MGSLPAFAPPQDTSRCLNCGTPIPDPRPRFCGHCGQETNLRAPRFFEFLQQLGGAYFSTEGALWRTLALLFKPGELTRQYLAGRRKHYVLPLRLFITISLLTLLLLRFMVPSDLTIGTQGAEALSKADPVVLDFRKGAGTLIDFGNGSRAGIDKDGRFYCEKMPRVFCERVQARLDIDAKSLARELKRLPERAISLWGTAMFFLVPLFALLQKIVYLGRGLRYTEHLIYALHVHSFWFMALALAMLPWNWVAGTMALLVPAYTLIAARRVYGGGWFSNLLRNFVVFIVYSAVSGITVGLVLLWALLS